MKGKNIYPIIIILILVIGLIFGIFYWHQRESRFSIPEDELKIFDQIQGAIQEDVRLEKESDTRIYAPTFPHYRKKFADFEESISGLSLQEHFDRQKSFEEANPEYKAYSKAVSDQLSKLFRWEDKIDEGKTFSAALYQIVEGKSKLNEGEELLKRYAEAAVHFWRIEEKYFWYIYCFRSNQLSEIFDCLDKNEKELGTFPEDLEEQRNAALITITTLGKKIEDIR